MSKSQKVIFFLHIPKTAGSTLRDILAKNYSNVHALYDGETIEKYRHRIETNDAELLSNLEIISGHMHYGWHEFLPMFDYRYVTLLRDPIERVISWYYHISRDTNHWLHHNAVSRNVTLLQFVSGLVPSELDNGQTRHLSGLRDSPFGCLGQDALDLAKQRLVDDKTTFGLTERFDDSLKLFEQALAWSDTGYRRVNVGGNRPQKEQNMQQVRQKIVEFNRLDIELYEFAKQEFDTQLQAFSQKQVYG